MKPSTIAYEEFRRKIADAVNASGLPAFVIAAELRGVVSEIEKIAMEQYMRDKASYENDVNSAPEPGA